MLKRFCLKTLLKHFFTNSFVKLDKIGLLFPCRFAIAYPMVLSLKKWRVVEKRISYLPALLVGR